MVGLVSRPPTQDRASHPAAADDNLQLEIRRHLEQRWSTYFPSLAARTPEIVCRRGADWRGFSVMLEYELKFDRFPSEHVLAKVRRDTKFGAYLPQDVTVAPELLRREFDELSRAYQYFDGRPDGLCVVRPLEYCDELNAMFIEKASGRDLGLVARSDEAEALAAFRRCGQWLRAFHEKVHQARPRVWTVGEFEARLTKRRGKLESLGVPPAHLGALLGDISATARNCRHREIPFSLLHGDYKLRHIWARPGSIQVFDFGNVHTGACYVDVAAFLVELSVLRLGHPWFEAQRVERYSQAFLHGYFTMRPPAVLGLFVVEALLKKWMRRRRTWSRTSTASTLHAYVRRIGAKSLVERWYLDRWFAARIREALQMTARGGRRGLWG
jgi:Ser/Thr protein kinase RdoA (MazF antagonist)